MAKFNTPADHMFRAGQISSKQWSRLSMTANGKGGKTHGRMAKFDHKHKDEGDTKIKAIASTRPGHIDGPDQGMRGKSAFAAPTRGGGVHGNTRKVGAGAINAHAKPKFPAVSRLVRGDKGASNLAGQKPMRTNPSGPIYGGGNRRP